MKTTQTKQINGQPAGPLERITLTRDHIASADGAALVTIAPNGDAQRAAPLFLVAYDSFDRAGRALGIDASELAESVDLAGLIDALRASEETLANLYRTGVIKTASNLSEDAKTIAVQDLLESLERRPRPNSTSYPRGTHKGQAPSNPVSL